MQAQMKPINAAPVVPPKTETAGVADPTVIRYGWNPFQPIYLWNGNGSVEYYIQPEYSPFHREIPKNQLIPFETFMHTDTTVDHSVEGSPLNPSARTIVTKTVTAYAAATALIRGYADRGYTVLNSLQGLPQEDAFRIFTVVHPFDYLLADLESEMEIGSIERIESEIPMTLAPDYTIQPLRSEQERVIARRLAAELADGARRALAYGTEILDKTEADIVAAHSGAKKVKSSPDPRDRFLERELDREIPKFIGKNKTDGSQVIADKLDTLIDVTKQTQSELELDRLRRENAELKAAMNATGETAIFEGTADALPPIEPQETENIPMQCVQLTKAGAQCRNAAIDGMYCRAHQTAGE